jgi:hypothetical protein
VADRPQCAPAGKEWNLSIIPLLAKTTFDPETNDLLAAAFDTAWKLLRASGSTLAAGPESAATRELLAKRIIEMAQRGERDAFKLIDDALMHLANARRVQIRADDIKSIDKV